MRRVHVEPDLLSRRILAVPIVLVKFIPDVSQMLFTRKKKPKQTNQGLYVFHLNIRLSILFVYLK